MLFSQVRHFPVPSRSMYLSFGLLLHYHPDLTQLENWGTTRTLLAYRLENGDELAHVRPRRRVARVHEGAFSGGHAGVAAPRARNSASAITLVMNP